jgi:uncharacterized protein (DUF2267 family)
LEDLMTKASVLESSLHRTHEWLRDIEEELHLDSEQAAYAALRATFHAVRDRLPVELVAHLGAELPMLIRGMYYEGWHPSSARLKEAHGTDFYDSVRRELRGHEELQHVDQVTRAVLRVIDQRLEPGQIAHVVEALPERVRRLWRDAH